jgi:hypothetical protein
LIKFAGARRVLFLVDRGNLGRQALKEFQAFRSSAQSMPVEATDRDWLAYSSQVSIHTRHCCRVKLGIAIDTVKRHLFQSTPGIAAGEAGRHLVDNQGSYCFNPHPALLPGEALLFGFAAMKNEVSIHTRHCCRVKPPPLQTLATQCRYSSESRTCNAAKMPGQSSARIRKYSA